MDIENFPYNETAKRFLTMVSPIYDESYVGKWLYEVMGREYQIAANIIRGLTEEAFPETATWTLPYWEQIYGIQTNESLPIEQRRKNISEVRNFKRPMNPARIEDLISRATGRTVKVVENTAPGCYAVEIYDGTSEADLNKIIEIVKKVKQSNKHVDIIFSTPITVRIRADPYMPGFSFPYTIAGTLPDVNTPGSYSQANVDVETDGNSSDIQYRPASEYAITGKYPDQAWQADLFSDGFAAGIETSYATSNYKICGSSPLKRGG